MTPGVRAALTLVALLAASSICATDYQHGTSYEIPLKYAAGFTRFEYASSDARNGGQENFRQLGTFDSFNKMLHKSRPPSGVSFIGVNNLIFERLLELVIDGPASFNETLVEGVWITDDFREALFLLHAEANRNPKLQRVAWIEP